jgi:hypothetical protein
MKGNISIPSAVVAFVLSLTAMAASAAATTFTSSAGTTPSYSAAAAGHTVFHNQISDIECASSMKGKVESHGSGVTAKGNLSALSFTGCTDDWHVTVVSAGSIEFHSLGGNGYLTSNGMTFEATRYGITCRYASANTSIGNITQGTTAVLHISSFVPFHGGSFLCGVAPARWTGSYLMTSPANVVIDS